MFIARDNHMILKLRRCDMDICRSYGAWVNGLGKLYKDLAPTEPWRS